MEWRSQSWMFNDPCDVCRIKRLDHDPHQFIHPYRSPILETAVHAKQPGDWEDVPSCFRHFERETNGEYEAPLPSPADRKRIREQAGLTQQDLADQLQEPRHGDAVGEASRMSEREEVAGTGAGWGAVTDILDLFCRICSPLSGLQPFHTSAPERESQT